TRNQAAIRQAVEHGEFFGKPQRFVQRQQVAVNQEFETFGPLRGGCRHQVWRVHQSVRRTMMFIETDAVIAETVHFFPGIEMLGVGANGHVRLEVPVRQRVGEFAADLEMVELFAIGEQVENENFHDALPRKPCDPPCWRNSPSGYDQSYRPAKSEKKIPHMCNTAQQRSHPDAASRVERSHFSMLLCIDRTNCCGLLPAGSRPCSMRNFPISGVLRASTAVLSNLSTIGRGVLAGAGTPFQPVASYSGMPACAIAGMSGATASRLPGHRRERWQPVPGVGAVKSMTACTKVSVLF